MMEKTPKVDKIIEIMLQISALGRMNLFTFRNYQKSCLDVFHSLWDKKHIWFLPFFVRSDIIFIFSNINVEVVQHILSNQWNFNYLFKITRQ